MKVTQNVGTGAPQSVKSNPAPAAAPAQEPAAPADSIDLSHITPELKKQAEEQLAVMGQARQQLDGALHTQIVGQAPGGFKELLEKIDVVLEQATKTEAGQNLDANFALAGEAGLFFSAGANAEARAELLEQKNQPADRGALFQEELGYLIQTNLLAPNLPAELVQKIAGTQVEGEAAVSAGTFVKMAIEQAQVSADDQKSLQAAASQEPAMQMLLADPKLAAQVGESLKNTPDAVAQMGSNATEYVGQVITVNQNLALAQTILMKAAEQGV